MKKLITNYTFDASEKKVYFDDLTTLNHDGVLLITNVTDGVIIYNFANPSLVGTVSGNVLTLNYNTTSMSDTDSLQIWYDDSVLPASQEYQDELLQLLMILKVLIRAIQNPSYVDKTTNQMRAQVTGTVTATVSSTAITNIDSIPGKTLMNSVAYQAWYSLNRVHI